MSERLITPREVAATYKVKPGTVSGWARQGKVRGTRTPGGQWRVYAADVEALLSAPTPDVPTP